MGISSHLLWTSCWIVDWEDSGSLMICRGQRWPCSGLHMRTLTLSPAAEADSLLGFPIFYFCLWVLSSLIACPSLLPSFPHPFYPYFHSSTLLCSVLFKSLLLLYMLYLVHVLHLQIFSFPLISYSAQNCSRLTCPYFFISFVLFSFSSLISSTLHFSPFILNLLFLLFPIFPCPK